MPDRIAIVEEFQSRLADFQEGYEWYETDGILRSFCVVGELLSAAFDPITAARGMQAMRLVVNTMPNRPMEWSKLDTEAPANWEELWGDLDGFNDSSYPALMEGAHNLNAFAYFGIVPTWDLSEMDLATAEFTDVPGYINGIVAKLSHFVGLLPKALGIYGVEEIEQTCLAATGRLKIDFSEPVTVHELAAVTRVTTKRLQNAIYAKTADSPIINKADGLIPVAMAQRWLEAREYKQSIWREFISVKGWEENGDLPDKAENSDEIGDYLFVPEARDGSVFSPIACKRGGQNGTPRYTIGAKGDEQDIESFDDALAALSKMSTPRWRRPNEQGNFGIVSAERWRRLSRNELFSI